MSEMKRPEQIGGDYRPHYRKQEVDAYIAALERRARIAERAVRKEASHRTPEYALDMHVMLALKDAAREIDAELAKEQAK